jgi:hypothetical protein
MASRGNSAVGSDSAGSVTAAWSAPLTTRWRVTNVVPT